ncbi:MAG: hypothetical protein ICCCNLDF_00781 [Planctomycetes bacterium]|nr:hypothetical protein [Planctomycetota bacterium]
MLFGIIMAGAVQAQTTLSASTNPNLVVANNTVACGSQIGFGQSDNSYLRTYTVAGTFQATRVRIGIEVDEVSPQTIDIRFWNYTAGTTAGTISLGAQIGSTTTITTPGDGSWNESVVDIGLDSVVSIPAGNFAVEVQQRSNQWTAGTGQRTGPGNFYFGSNQAGQSSPSYLMAAGCSITDPTDTTAYGTVHVILDVIGYLNPSTAPAQEIDLRYPSGAAYSLASGSGVADVGPLPRSATTAAVVQVANQGTGTLSISGATATGATGCTTGTITFPASLAAGANGNVSIPVTLGATLGTWSFTLTVSSNDPNEASYTITVQGTAGMSGTYTVIAAGGGDYTNIGAAFDDLETYGLGGATTIEVGAGTYASNASYELGTDTGGAVVQRVRGTSTTSRLTIQAASGASPIVSGDSFIDPASGTESGTMSIWGVSHVTIDGLEFTGGAGFGLLIGHTAGLNFSSQPSRAARDVEVLNCKFHDITAGPGLVFTGDLAPFHDVLIENCMVWHCVGGNSAYSLNWPGSIAFFYPGENVVINHPSVLMDNGATGATTGRPGAIGWRGGPEAVRTSPSITNCVLSASGTNMPIFSFPSDDAAQAATVTSEPTASDRNVLFPQNGGIIGLAFFGTSTTPYNTLQSWQLAFNTLDANSTANNPNFVSATDLHISTGSSAIDLAVGSATTLDIDGDARTTGAAPDAGADEFTGGGGGGGTVSVAATSTPASEPSTNGAWTITFSTATTATTSVSFTLSGAAVLGTDYSISSSVGTASGTGITGIPAGTSSVVVTLTVIDDALVEGNEDAIMTITGATGYTVGTPSAGTVVINDDDASAGNPAVSVSSTGSPSETGPTSGTFTISASPNPAAPIQVNVSFSGTAVNGTDYTVTGVTGGQVTVPTTGSVTVTITPIDDTATEGLESVILTITTGTGYTVGTQSAATLTIADNDGTPPPPITGGGGGGGGGGGYTAAEGSSYWMLALGLLAVLGLGLRMRARRE